MARHVLHDSLKKLVSKGDKAQMLAYYEGKSKDRKIIAPSSKGDFKIQQTMVSDLSNKNLKDKTYKGIVNGWVGSMTGDEAVRFMIDRAAESKGGVDLVNGYDYTQLISKFLMGAVFYNQAVDVYLDEKLEADTKPNDQPYKKGVAYTGKEHIWDEAFGYFGAPAHGMTLSAKQVYGIAKRTDLAAADFNQDGMVNLYTEMAFAHGYYAASLDKGGKTSYFHDITQAFLDGRNLLVAAKGQKLTDSQRATLKGHAAIIKRNWEKVIAELVFKYAGSTYKDLVKITGNSGNAKENYRNYIKHWGELKGFALALQVGGKDLGGTSVQLNRLVGYGPVMIGNTQVKGLDGSGEYMQGASVTMEEYMLNLLKVQNLMKEEFGIKARLKDQTAGLEKLVQELATKDNSEND